MAHSSYGLSRVELEREIRWRLRTAPKDPDELLDFIGHLIADMVSTNNTALAKQLDDRGTEELTEEY